MQALPAPSAGPMHLTSGYIHAHTPFKSHLAPQATGQVLSTFGFCARPVRQGAHGVCASRRSLVFQKERNTVLIPFDRRWS